MFPVFNNFSEALYMKVGLDVRISFVRVLSTGGGGGSFPFKKSFPEKIQSYFKYLFNDDIKESVNATNAQKCNFSQS